MSTLVPSDECAFCDHIYREHENGLFCKVDDCNCVEFISESEMFEDEELNEFDEEEVENIFTALKSVFFLSHSIRETLKIYQNIDNGEVYDKARANIERSCYGLEKIAELISVYFDKDLPPIDDIEKEFSERREFEKLLNL